MMSMLIQSFPAFVKPLKVAFALSVLKQINMNPVFISTHCILDSIEQMGLMETTVIVFASFLLKNLY